MTPRPPRSTLFPYTTLFRSQNVHIEATVMTDEFASYNPLKRNGYNHQKVKHGQRQYVVGDRKSTRLNSSHLVISYAVFCLKKKKKDAHPLLQMSIRNRENFAGGAQMIILVYLARVLEFCLTVLGCY